MTASLLPSSHQGFKLGSNPNQHVLRHHGATYWRSVVSVVGNRPYVRIALYSFIISGDSSYWHWLRSWFHNLWVTEQRLEGFSDQPALPVKRQRQALKVAPEFWLRVPPAFPQGIRMWHMAVSHVRMAEGITLKLSVFPISSLPFAASTIRAIRWHLGKVSSLSCCPRLRRGPLQWDLRISSAFQAFDCSIPAGCRAALCIFTDLSHLSLPFF